MKAITFDEILKLIPDKKSILAMCAYSGGDVSKKWINDMGQYCDGYNRALEDVRAAIQRENEATR